MIMGVMSGGDLQVRCSCWFVLLVVVVVERVVEIARQQSQHD
jgi:hypothetical protein